MNNFILLAAPVHPFLLYLQDRGISTSVYKGVEAPGWQGAKAQEYVNISSFALYKDVQVSCSTGCARATNAVRRYASAIKNIKSFIYRP